MANDYKSEEEVLGKAYDSKLMKRLLGYIKPYKKYVIFAIVLNIIVAALPAVRPLLTKIAVDKYIANKDYSRLSKYKSAAFRISSAADSNAVLLNLLYTISWTKNNL